jgi:hypothetical protein
MPKWGRLRIAKPLRRDANILSLLSNPFILWLLSAVFISVGGGYLTRRQECIAAARADIMLFKQLELEIAGRRSRIIHALETASNRIDFRRQATARDFVTFKQFDGQPLESLLHQQVELESNIEGGSIIEQTFFAREVQIPPPSFLIRLLARGSRILEYQWDREQLPSWGSQILVDLNDVYWARLNFITENRLEPNCSAITLFGDIFSSTASPHMKFIVTKNGSTQ